MYFIDNATANNLSTNTAGTTTTPPSIPNTPSKSRMNPIVVLEECTMDDYAPLFYSPGKCGFYSPREGYASYERLNAFRNVGRYVNTINLTLTHLFITNLNCFSIFFFQID